MSRRTPGVIAAVRQALGRTPNSPVAPRPALLPPRTPASPADELDTLLDEIGKLYVTAAAARGVSGGRLLWRYPARHALGPIVNSLGFDLNRIFNELPIVALIMTLTETGALLIEALVGLGAKHSRLSAQLCGGAQVLSAPGFEENGLHIGKRNVSAAESAAPHAPHSSASDGTRAPHAGQRIRSAKGSPRGVERRVRTAAGKGSSGGAGWTVRGVTEVATIPPSVSVTTLRRFAF